MAKVWSPYVVKSVKAITIDVAGQEHPTGRTLLRLQPAGGRARPSGRVEHEVEATAAGSFPVGSAVRVTVETLTTDMAPYGGEA